MEKEQSRNDTNWHRGAHASSGTCYFVSVHPGALAWARRHHWGVRTVHVTELDLQAIRSGDTVIGTLPQYQAIEVCARGACYLHLTMDMSFGSCECRMDPEAMDAANARLVPCQVIKTVRINIRQTRKPYRAA